MSKRTRIRLQRAAVVLGVLEDRTGQSTCRKAFGEAFVPIAQAQELDRRLSRHLVDLIIVSPWDGTGTRVAPSLQKIAMRPHPLIAAYVDQQPAALRELPALFRAGAAEIILRGKDDTAIALRALRDRGGIAAVASEAIDMAAAVVPPALLSLLQHCFAEVCDATSSDTSSAIRRAARDLSRLAYRAGVPGIRETRSRCRLVIAVGLQLRTGETLEKVALRLGYSSSAALHNLLRRYAGVRAAELARHGDWPYWTRRLLHVRP